MRIPYLALLAALVFCSALSPMRAAEKPDAAAAVELEVYDVSDLTTSVTDYPAPGLLTRSAGGNIVDPFATATPVPGLKVPDIVTLIHDRFMPGDFADPATSIAENNGSIVVMARKSTRERIAQVIAALHHQFKLQVAVKALLIPSAENPTATVFDAESIAKLQGATAALAAPRMVCMNGQLTHTRSGKLFNYIRDYDIAGAVYAPVISTAMDGCVLEARPIICDDGASTTMMLRFTYSVRTGKTETRNIVLAPPARAATLFQNGDVKAGDALAANIILPIDVPAMNIQDINTDVRIPKGKWILAGVMNNPDKEAKEKRLLLFVSAETLSLVPAPPPLPLDARLLIAPNPHPRQAPAPDVKKNEKVDKDF